MPAPTLQERQDAAALAALTAAVAAYSGVCVCCGSDDQTTFTFVVRLGTRLKVLEQRTATLAAISRTQPANSEMRCGNCYAIYSNTGECLH